MKQIYRYKIYFFGDKKEESIYISQEQGQKLLMVLASDATRKFVMIDDNLVNTSSINRIIKENEIENYVVDGKMLEKPAVRPLTKSEEETQKLFDGFKNKKLLLN